MSVAGLLGQSATIYRQSPGQTVASVLVTSDAEGNPLETETTTTSSVAVRCRLEPFSGSELPAGAPLQEGLFHLLLLPDAPIDGSDRVEVEGRSYEVVGPPAVWPDRSGDAHHIVATVRYVEV